MSSATYKRCCERGVGSKRSKNKLVKPDKEKPDQQGAGMRDIPLSTSQVMLDCVFRMVGRTASVSCLAWRAHQHETQRVKVY